MLLGVTGLFQLTLKWVNRRESFKLFQRAKNRLYVGYAVHITHLKSQHSQETKFISASSKTEYQRYAGIFIKRYFSLEFFFFTSGNFVSALILPTFSLVS